MVNGLRDILFCYYDFFCLFAMKCNILIVYGARYFLGEVFITKFIKEVIVYSYFINSCFFLIVKMNFVSRSLSEN